MPETWATSAGLDLHLDRSGARVRAGLEQALRDAVRDGRLSPGARLPSSRTLAADLGIARNTVTEAYSQLVAEGWLAARRGSGTRVAEQVPVAPASATTAPSPLDEDGTRPLSRLAATASLRHDLTPGRPDLAAFPRAAWLAAARRALAAASPAVYGYTDPRGLPELRAALATYLARARGVRADPERIVVCAGFTHGWSLLCDLLRVAGARSVAMEVHGVQHHRHVVAHRGLAVRNLAVDGHGAVIDPGDAGAVLLTAAHQFPHGVALAPERRTAAIRWAQESGGVVVEDDYDGEFRYGRQPVGAMQALAPEQVVYAGTTAKSVAPGLRVGWLVLPAALVEPVSEAQALTTVNPPVIEQLALAELIGSGTYDRHVRRARLSYRRRRDRLLSVVTSHAPRIGVTGIAAGQHALLTLPDGVAEETVTEAGARRGLELTGLARFTNDGAAAARAALVIGYGTPPEHAYTSALARLDATLTETCTAG